VTDCHVDALARFSIDRVSSNNTNSDPRADVFLSRPHESRPGTWMQVYEEAREVLDQKTAERREIRVVDIQKKPISSWAGRAEGGDVAPSYVNFVWANGGLEVPAFGHGEADRRAVEMIEKDPLGGRSPR
jgi:agmatine/peptidylarginine deiminase